MAMLDASLIGAALARTLVHGAPYALATWGACRLLPGLSARVRVVLWWLCALKLAASLVPLPAVTLRVLPPAPSSSMVRLHDAVGGAVASAPEPRAVSQAAAATGTALPDSESRARAWMSIVVAAWLGGVGMLGAMAVARTRRARAFVRRAEAALPAVASQAARLAAQLGLRRTPDVRVSGEIDTPQVVGLLRPVVLLPADRLSGLHEEELEMALCHELLHVRHLDIWLGLVPAVVERLLFFNPLAHLAAREYALAREAACDAGVLRALGVAPAEYGRLLLSLGTPRPSRALVGVGATSSFTALKWRLTMLESFTRSPRVRSAGWALSACAVCALVPITLAARTAAPRVPESAVAASPAHAAVQAAPTTHGQVRHNNEGRELSWVLFEQGDNDTHMSGSTEDVRQARAARQGREALLWVRRHGRAFAIRDAASIAKVRALFDPMETLGRQQGELGSQQAAIGAKMAEVGRQQGEIGAKQGALGAKQAAIGARQAAEAARIATRAGKADSVSEVQLDQLDTQMEALGKQMDALGEQMETLSKPMEELGRQMEPLGAEQDKLGAQMEALAERATEGLAALVDEAIANGLATELK